MTSFLSGLHKMYTGTSTSTHQHGRQNDNHHHDHHDTSSNDAATNSNTSFVAASIFMDGMTISLAMFSISAICFTKYITQQQHRRSSIENVPFFQRRRKSLHDLCILHDNEEMNRNEYDGNNNTTQNSKSSSSSTGSMMMMMISNRGKTALLPVIPYQKQFFTALGVRNNLLFVS